MEMCNVTAFQRAFCVYTYMVNRISFNQGFDIRLRIVGCLKAARDFVGAQLDFLLALELMDGSREWSCLTKQFRGPIRAEALNWYIQLTRATTLLLRTEITPDRAAGPSRVDGVRS